MAVTTYEVVRAVEIREPANQEPEYWVFRRTTRDEYHEGEHDHFERLDTFATKNEAYAYIQKLESA